MAGLLGRSGMPTPTISASTFQLSPGRSGGKPGIDDGNSSAGGDLRLDLAPHLLRRTYGPRIALAVEVMSLESRGSVWTDTGQAQAV